MKTVKIKVHAGGGWEGHVVYVASHPEQPEIENSSSNLEEVEAFCRKHNLAMDAKFVELVRKHFIYIHQHGLVIPTEYIDEHQPISSASKYLKDHFPGYC